MAISKENGKKRLPIFLYVFLFCVLLNILWIEYVNFTDKALSYLGVKDTVQFRVFFACFSYPTEWLITLFAIVYYAITKKKLFGFWIIVLLTLCMIIATVAVINYDFQRSLQHPLLPHD
jgi:F0F1-type ATP synthase membrane subunit a